MPELPEVEALASFLREHAVGQVVASVEVAAISVLKTYDPPPTSLGGLTVVGVGRRGKFLDLDVDGLAPGHAPGPRGVAALAGSAAGRARPPRQGAARAAGAVRLAGPAST